MSTSPSRSPAANPAAAALRASAPAALSPTLQPFPYDSIPPGASARDRMASGSGSGAALDVGAAEAVTRETQARAQGRQEGLTEARKNFDEQLARERASLAAAL